MPLLDHFHGPVERKRRWESFHNAWPTYITQRLNAKLLPARYYAEPNVHLGVSMEADVTTHETEEKEADAADGAVATAVWAPPKPPLVVPLAFDDLDVVEVRVYDEHRAMTLVAVIELVSPANKDRPSHRRAFATKCAAYLQHSVSVVVVDLVTERKENLHAELMRLLELEEAAPGFAPDLYAVAYRTATAEGRLSLEAWPEALTLGAPLPRMPLWLTPDLAVPLDLEASYAETCETLRIPG